MKDSVWIKVNCCLAQWPHWGYALVTFWPSWGHALAGSVSRQKQNGNNILKQMQLPFFSPFQPVLSLFFFFFWGWHVSASRWGQLFGLYQVSQKLGTETFYRRLNIIYIWDIVYIDSITYATCHNFLMMVSKCNVHNIILSWNQKNWHSAVQSLNSWEQTVDESLRWCFRSA